MDLQRDEIKVGLLALQQSAALKIGNQAFFLPIAIAGRLWPLLAIKFGAKGGVIRHFHRPAGFGLCQSAFCGGPDIGGNLGFGELY